MNELAEALDAKVAEARAEVRRRGWTFLGAKRARTVSPFKQAVACEVFGGRNPDLSTYGLSPEEAARVKREYIACHRAYHECRQRMLRGETDVLWPPGTWAMVQHFGQRSWPIPTAAWADVDTSATRMRRVATPMGSPRVDDAAILLSNGWVRPRRALFRPFEARGREPITA